MKIAIIDDDEKFVDFMTGQIVEKAQNIGVEVDVGKYCNHRDVLKDVFEYELVFLDIEMPDINGLKLMEQINVAKSDRELPLVVFVTNKDNYVHTALSKYPFSFMRKSCVEADLEMCMIRAGKLIRQLTKSEYYVSLKGNNVAIAVNEIIYIEKRQHNIIYKCIKNEYEERENIAEKAEELEPLGFVRIHEGFVVNIEHIRRLRTTKVLVSNNEELILSRKYKESTKEKYYEWINRKARRNLW